MIIFVELLSFRTCQTKSWSFGAICYASPRPRHTFCEKAQRSRLYTGPCDLRAFEAECCYLLQVYDIRVAWKKTRLCCRSEALSVPPLACALPKHKFPFGLRRKQFQVVHQTLIGRWKRHYTFTFSAKPTRASNFFELARPRPGTDLLAKLNLTVEGRRKIYSRKAWAYLYSTFSWGSCWSCLVCFFICHIRKSFQTFITFVDWA